MVSKGFLGVAGVLIVGAIYNLDSLSGEWKFADYCKNEGGSRFYAQVERNVGWEVETEDEAGYKTPFSIGNVTFVRFRDKHGDLFDVHTKPGPTPWAKDYSIMPADMAKRPKYRLTTEMGLLPDDARIGRVRYMMTEIDLGIVVAMHTYFNYSWTTPERVVLSAPTSRSCHAGEAVDSFFSTIFKPGMKLKALAN